MKRGLLLILFLLMPSAYGFSLEVLNTDPAPPIAGEYVDVTIQLRENENELGDIVHENLIIAVKENDDIRVQGDTEEYVGRFSSAESLTRTFRLFIAQDVPGGFIDIPFTVSSQFTSQEIIGRIFIQDARSLPDLRIGEIESVPDELLEDTDDNKIIVTLQNLGETKAELVRAEMKHNKRDLVPASSFSLIDSVASIDAGGEAELEFEFDIQEDVKEDMPVTFEARYRSRHSVNDTYRVFEDKIRATLPLAESPVLKVVEVEQDTLKTGTTDNKIKVLVANEGTKKAESVRLRLHPDISYPFIFDVTTVYITSELEPGEQATVEFEVEATNDGISRSYPINVELESIVGEALYSKEDTITLEVTKAATISNRMIGMSVIAVVILIAVGFGVYNKLRKRGSLKRK